MSIIKNLTNKQCELDPIPCKILKDVASSIVPTITKIINSSFEFGIFPKELKKSIINPILKNMYENPDLLIHFRPVCFISIVSKIYEKCILTQLVEYLNVNDLLAKNQ